VDKTLTPLHEKATRRSSPQATQRKRAKPPARQPHRRKSRNSCSIYAGFTGLAGWHGAPLYAAWRSYRPPMSAAIPQSPSCTGPSGIISRLSAHRRRRPATARASRALNLSLALRRSRRLTTAVAAVFGPVRVEAAFPARFYGVTGHAVQGFAPTGGAFGAPRTPCPSRGERLLCPQADACWRSPSHHQPIVA
jgi:hypothetical protein